MHEGPSVKKIVLLPGDGVGPEIMQQSVKLLRALEEPFDLRFEFEELPVGGKSMKQFGVPLSAETLEACQAADAVLLGPVGDAAYDKNPDELRPKHALVELRTGLGAYCNIRSIRVRNVVPQHLPVTSTVTKNIDFVVVQTMRNGYYYHEIAHKNAHWETTPERSTFSKSEIRRVARRAFQLAQIRRRKLTAVTDLSSPTSSRMWRSIVEETHAEYPGVKLELVHITDAIEMLDRSPYEFDVIFSESRYAMKVNEAAGKLSESVGMLASACLGSGVSIFQPIHDTDQKIVGKNLANPIAMMNSIALMLHYSFGMSLAAHNIEDAIATVVARGYHTIDMPVPNGVAVGTEEMVNYVLEEVLHCLGAPFLTA